MSHSPSALEKLLSIPDIVSWSFSSGGDAALLPLRGFSPWAVLIGLAAVTLSAARTEGTTGGDLDLLVLPVVTWRRSVYSSISSSSSSKPSSGVVACSRYRVSLPADLALEDDEVPPTGAGSLPVGLSLMER